MQDLNTRLRRVITSYQRNYKKEELKQQQKAKVRHFFHKMRASMHIVVIFPLTFTPSPKNKHIKHIILHSFKIQGAYDEGQRLNCFVS